MHETDVRRRDPPFRFDLIHFSYGFSYDSAYGPGFGRIGIQKRNSPRKPAGL